MARRVVTAREQHQMLAPWRTAERADRFEWQRSADGDGGWILVTRNPDGNPVALDTRRAPSVRISALQQRPRWSDEDRADSGTLWDRPTSLGEDFDPFENLEDLMR